jgi:hypothetical protein
MRGMSCIFQKLTTWRRGELSRILRQSLFRGVTVLTCHQPGAVVSTLQELHSTQALSGHGAMSLVSPCDFSVYRTELLDELIDLPIDEYVAIFHVLFMLLSGLGPTCSDTVHGAAAACVAQCCRMDCGCDTSVTKRDEEWWLGKLHCAGTLNTMVVFLVV